MPTRALRHRIPLLERALESVLTQEAVRVVPLVVINGPDGDPEFTRRLSADRRLRVIQLEEADLPTALRTGRKKVDSEYFAELDDDDFMLPQALMVRVQALEELPDLDAVITNGFRRGSDGDKLHINHIAMVEQDPLRALFHGNWLLPGSWLCRTGTVGPELFDGMPRYRECTYFALQLATIYRIKFLDHPTVVWHADTPFSESKSRGYALGEEAALRRILELDLPEDVRVHFQSKLAGAYHIGADLHLREGNRKGAWSWHLQSLRQPGGWRYLPFTRKLFSALLRS